LSGDARRQTPSQALRFLVVGGINTVLTGVIFLGLSTVSAPALAYTVAFVTGIAFAVIVTPRVVFRARASNLQRIRYVGWYLAVYLFGLGVVYVLHDGFELGNTAVVALTFVVTAGLSFLGARFLFDQRAGDAAVAIDRRSKVQE